MGHRIPLRPMARMPTRVRSNALEALMSDTYLLEHASHRENAACACSDDGRSRVTCSPLITPFWSAYYSNTRRRSPHFRRRRMCGSIRWRMHNQVIWDDNAGKLRMRYHELATESTTFVWAESLGVEGREADREPQYQFGSSERKVVAHGSAFYYLLFDCEYYGAVVIVFLYISHSRKAKDSRRKDSRACMLRYIRLFFFFNQVDSF